MNKPVWKEVIFERPIACLASSVALLVELLSESCQEGCWYGSDILIPGSELSSLSDAHPEKIGSSDQLLTLLKKAGQFESGVLLLFPTDQGKQLKDSYWTEDDEFRDMGEAIIEVRMFDTNFYEIYGKDHEMKKVVKEFASLIAERAKRGLSFQWENIDPAIRFRGPPVSM